MTAMMLDMLGTELRRDRFEAPEVARWVFGFGMTCGIPVRCRPRAWTRGGGSEAFALPTMREPSRSAGHRQELAWRKRAAPRRLSSVALRAA